MKKNKGLFWGLLLVFGAIFVVVGKLGYFKEVNTIGIVISVLLVCYMIRSIVKVSFSGILFPAAFLCIIYDKQLGLEAITPWTVLFAALLGSIGLSMIFHKKPKHKEITDHSDYWEKKHWHDHWCHGGNADELSGEYVFSMHRFTGATQYIRSTDVVKAELKNSFGESSYYFDEVKTKEDYAEIYVDNSFGELNLYLPKEWTVVNEVSAWLGEVREQGNNRGEEAPVVKVKGSVSFGEVKIIYI